MKRCILKASTVRYGSSMLGAFDKEASRVHGDPVVLTEAIKDAIRGQRAAIRASLQHTYVPIRQSFCKRGVRG